MKTARVEKLCAKMREKGVDQVIVTSKENIFYFTGAYLDPMERLLVLLINADGTSTYYVNRLFFIDPCVQTDIVFWDDIEDPTEKVAANIKKGALVAVDKDWPARFLLSVMNQRPDAKYVVMPELVDDLRAIKDDEELELLTHSSWINDRVMEQLLENIKPDITEAQLAKMRYEMYAELGANAYGMPCIFSYGAHCAEAHHVSDDTYVKPGDSVMIDMGAPYKMYQSDMTRTVFYKEVSPELEKIYNIVHKAHMTAAAAIKPGVPCSMIDKVARDIITEAGYGEYFTHRTGHGIGMDPHEFPDISQKCDRLLEAGMVHSVEPGIYVPGMGGVRIENLFAVTEDGSRSLNNLSRDLRVID